MQSDIGRFLESHRLEMQQLIRVVYDACCGQGKNVAAKLQGKELAFSTEEDGDDFGFVRLMPLATSAILSFPRGHEIPDPQGRTNGAVNSRTSMTLYYASDVDVYVRRMIGIAYTLEQD